VSWTRVYRLALYLLPPRLRSKHGGAMESLFARELERAQERGRLPGALAGAAGLWDAVRRGVYERLRAVPDTLRALRDDRAQGSWSTNAAGANLGEQSMPSPPPRQLLRRHATTFGVSLSVLTGMLLANVAVQRLPSMWARGDSAGTLVEVLLLSLPHTMALTIPMSVFVAVLWVFTRLGAEGVLAAARLERGGLRRLLAPVLWAAIGLAAFTYVSNTEILPRANARLGEVLAGVPLRPSDRTMTVAELRAAARSARAEAGPRALERAAAFEVEVQKKYALAAASFVLALAGAAIALRFPRGRAGLVFGASCAVFYAYYLCLVAGETLADRQVASPFVGMWTANGLFLAAALLVVWRIGTSRATRDDGPLAIGG
jgi:hypothetical protein